MSFRRSFDLSVYFIADPSVCTGRNVIDVVRLAARGGASMIQLRDKFSDSQQIESNVLAIQAILKPLNIPFILNDHVNIAVKLGLDGVHIGQEDMSPQEARILMGKDAIIGLTAYTSSHFSKLDPDCVDYVGTGPFYSTLTKPDKPVLGQQGFSSLAKLSPVPVVAIGGITHENAQSAIKAGAQGVSMMRSVSEADDPCAAILKFVKLIKEVKP